jgi:hypothetical protein
MAAVIGAPRPAQGPATGGNGNTSHPPPIDVDGREVLAAEELADIGAVFPFAGGRR